MWPTPAEWQIVGFTLVVCALSTLIILPFGLAVAWPLARYRWPGKILVETLVTLPLVLPPVATGLILLKFLGRRSGVGRFLHEHLGSTSSSPGARLLLRLLSCRFRSGAFRACRIPNRQSTF